MKPEWGARRTCKKCNAAFYDLKKDPITCPKCGKIHTVEDFTSKYSRTAKGTHKIEEVLPKIEDVAIEDLVVDVDVDDLDDDADDLIDADRIAEEDL